MQKEENGIITENINLHSTHIMLKTDIKKDIRPFIQEQRNIISNELKIWNCVQVDQVALLNEKKKEIKWHH